MEPLGSPSPRDRETCTLSMETVEAAALNAGREALAQLEVCSAWWEGVVTHQRAAQLTVPAPLRLPQSVSADALTESVRQLAAFDERVRAAASAAWTELPSASLLKSVPTQPPLGTPNDAGGAAAWEEQHSGAASGDSRELSSALALAQQLLARQRAETEHWKSEAERWRLASATTGASADESPDSPVAALAAARLELARSRELLTQVSAERDALRIRLMAVQEMGYAAPAHVPGQPGARQRGHSGLLRAAAEELAAHAAAREAANVAADEASALVAAVSARPSMGAVAEGEGNVVGGGDSPTLGGRKHSAGSPAESAARLRERMLRQTGEDEG